MNHDAKVEYEVTWAGTPADGQEPLSTFAFTVLALHKQARLADGHAIVSGVLIAGTDEAARPTVVIAHVEMTAPEIQAAQEATDTVMRQTRERADRDGTSVLIVARTQV